MSQSQTKLEELPFSFQGVEEKYGSLIDAEELCPGVYYASARLLERYTFLVAQYMVVTASSPAISPEARAYGAPLPDGALIFEANDYYDKGQHVVRYEAHKYLADHGLPLPEAESLLGDRVFGMEVCPEYFGQLPVPTDTPWGPPLRHDRLGNGLYWLETEYAGWVLALAYPIREDLMFHTRVFAALMPTDRERGLDNTFGYCFYPFEVSCIPLFELLEYGERDWADKIDIAALKNAILKFYPDYLKPDLYERQNPPSIAATPGAGTDFYRFPA